MPMLSDGAYPSMLSRRRSWPWRCCCWRRAAHWANRCRCPCSGSRLTAAWRRSPRPACRECRRGGVRSGGGDRGRSPRVQGAPATAAAVLSHGSAEADQPVHAEAVKTFGNRPTHTKSKVSHESVKTPKVRVASKASVSQPADVSAQIVDLATRNGGRFRPRAFVVSHGCSTACRRARRIGPLRH